MATIAKSAEFEGRIGFGREWLAPYATLPGESRGRLFAEAESPTRTPFQRDRDRIIHSTAFRRLKHKTQVFVYHEGDHFRTRLTHSIEVAQIARALARALRVDEDLAEALALAHDLGHTPFGHTGEDALDEMMKPWGGFDHNAQALRIVTRLERRYAEFDGLNLSWETLEGLVKHNGPLSGHIPAPILEFNELFDLELASYAGLEAQCAALADDIAYDAHDLDDGLRAGLFQLEELEEIPLAGATLRQVRTAYPALDAQRAVHEIVRRQITVMVEDAIRTALENIGSVQPASAADARNCGRTLVSFSAGMAASDRQIKAFLFSHLYRAPSVMRVRADARKIVCDLFSAFFEGRAQMPNEWGMDWQKAVGRVGQAKRARLVADFIAGMTDRYAISEHRRLFDDTPELV